MLTATGLYKAYAEGEQVHEVLGGLDLEVARGDSVALLGRSGSGKSTLLNLLSGIDRPDAGEVRFEGRSLTALDDGARTRLRRRHMGFVFQFFNLLPSLTVLDNVVLPQTLNGTGRAAARRHALALLDEVGLAGRADAHADRLSGGEQQRVALVRAIAHGPALVFADEPTGNLDEASAAQALDLLMGLVSARHTTLVMATHSAEAAARCQRVERIVDGRLAGRPAPAGRR